MNTRFLTTTAALALAAATTVAATPAHAQAVAPTMQYQIHLSGVTATLRPPSGLAAVSSIPLPRSYTYTLSFTSLSPLLQNANNYTVYVFPATVSTPALRMRDFIDQQYVADESLLSAFGYPVVHQHHALRFGHPLWVLQREKTNPDTHEVTCSLWYGSSQKRRGFVLRTDVTESCAAWRPTALRVLDAIQKTIS